MNNQEVMVSVWPQFQSSVEGNGVNFFEGNALLSLDSEKFADAKEHKVPNSMRSCFIKAKSGLHCCILCFISLYD